MVDSCRECELSNRDVCINRLLPSEHATLRIQHSIDCLGVCPFARLRAASATTTDEYQRRLISIQSKLGGCSRSEFSERNVLCAFDMACCIFIRLTHINQSQ